MPTSTRAKRKAIRGDAKGKPRALAKRRLLGILLVCLLGLVLSTVLTVVHYRTHTDPAYQAICAVSARINCESVALSHYSLWLGVPVSAWGMLCYLAVAGLCLSGLWRTRLHPGWPLGLLTLLAAAATAVSVYLAYVSVTRIDSVCIYCTGLYLANLAWLGIALYRRVSYKALRDGVIADATALLHRPRLAMALGLVALGVTTATMGLYPHYWEALAQNGQGIEEGSSGGAKGGEHWIGSSKPRVTVVEYTDYECPHCRRAHRDARAQVARAEPPARLVHKHFPLDQACNPIVKRPFHRRACELSYFVECAGRQGKFWAANDAVFSALERARAADLDLALLGAEIGLDAVEIERCMAEPAIHEIVARDVADGLALDVRGTPTYLVGSARYAGRLPPGLLDGASTAAPASGSGQPGR